MKSFSWIVFLALLVIISSAFAGYVKENAVGIMSPEHRKCYKKIVNKIGECPVECKSYIVPMPIKHEVRSPNSGTAQYRCAIEPNK